ncbi:hypothetical protein Bca4012_067702 [Brassica carinata]
MHLESFVMSLMLNIARVLFKRQFKYGKIDIVVCNAAVNPFTDPILSTPESALDKLWEVNVRSSILLLHVSTNHFA